MLFRRFLPPEIRKAYSYDSIAAILAGIHLGLILPFLAIVDRRLGGYPYHIALITAAPFFGSLLTYYWAHRAQLEGEKKYVVWGSFIARSLFFAMAFIVTPLAFTLVASLALLMGSISRPAYVGVLSQIYPERYRGRAMGFVMVGSSAAAMLAAYFGGKSLDAVGYRWIFPAGAFFGIISSFIFNKIDVKEKLHQDVPAKFRFTEMFEILRRNDAFNRFQRYYMIFGFSNLIAVPIYPLFLVDKLYISNFEAGKLACVSSIIGILTVYIWGHLSDKRGAPKVMSWNILLLSFVPLIYAFADKFWVLYFASAASGAAFAGLELLVVGSAISLSKGKDVPKYSAIHTTLLGIRGVVAPFLGISLLHLLGFRGVFLLSFAGIVTGGILLYLWSREYKLTSTKSLC